MLNKLLVTSMIALLSISQPVLAAKKKVEAVEKKITCITVSGAKEKVATPEDCAKFTKADNAKVAAEKKKEYDAAMDKKKYSNVVCLSESGTGRTAKSSEECRGYSKEAVVVPLKKGERPLE